jgi:O-6-methylguanine DNA methyltransferase
MKRQRALLQAILKNKKLSDFERSVYRAALTIPKGQTRSYQWIAGRIGRPGACRAVGNALHKNPYPVVVPCHRVICADGSLGGFARGAGAKKRLLEREGVDCARIGCYNQGHPTKRG